MAKSVLLLYIAVEQFAYTVRSGYISLAERDTVKLNISSASGKPIYEQIEDQIRAAIMSGELQTGEALPSLRKLAKELHISVLTIARAYSELADEGLVENVQGKGTFVLPLQHIETARIPVVRHEPIDEEPKPSVVRPPWSVLFSDYSNRFTYHDIASAERAQRGDTIIDLSLIHI